MTQKIQIIVELLTKYTTDNGQTLTQEVGPEAAKIVLQLRDVVLHKIETIDPKTAERYLTNPQGYKTPLQDDLTELSEADAGFWQTCDQLLMKYQALQKKPSTAGSTYRANISDKGVVIQGSTITTGDGCVVGVQSDGPIITNSPGTMASTAGDVTHQQGVSGETLNHLFTTIYQAIERQATISPQQKEEVKGVVAEIEAKAVEPQTQQNPEKLDWKGFLTQRLQNIENIAPDIIDVILATTGNPVAGGAVILAKIRKKATEIRQAREAGA